MLKLQYHWILVVLGMWVAFASPTSAQFLCTVSLRPDIAPDTSYDLMALTCRGSYCFAAAVRTNRGDTGWLDILSSTDGGISWSVQAPPLPSFPPFSTSPSITTFDQLDSLHVFAIGDSNLLLRTKNGGAGWEKLTVPGSFQVQGISFSSATDGILAAGTELFLTSDGGDHWDRLPFVKDYAWYPHDYGGGKYRVATYFYGQIYSTTNGWNSVDSTSPIPVDTTGGATAGYGTFAFGKGDTIFAGGVRYNYKNHRSPLISRTTDGGQHWTIAYQDTTGYGEVYYFSDVNRDTIIASGRNCNYTVYESTDRGTTWRAESLICHDTDFDGSQSFGIGLNDRGELVGTFSLYTINSTIVVGREAQLNVASRMALDTSLAYPNPARDLVILPGADVEKIFVMDVLGRSYSVQHDGGSLDVSPLPAGVYYITDGLHLTRLVKE